MCIEKLSFSIKRKDSEVSLEQKGFPVIIFFEGSPSRINTGSSFAQQVLFKEKANQCRISTCQIKL